MSQNEHFLANAPGILRRTIGGGGGSAMNKFIIHGHRASQVAESKAIQLEDLFAFGYACKIFRDDAKALQLDQGQHLIPWMGDESLKIDRYDVRGTLYDLRGFEPPAGGYGNRLEYLSAEEQRAEQLCEEERYRDLYANASNVEASCSQIDEACERLKNETGGTNVYCEVGFQYDDDVDNATPEQPQFPEQSPFVLPEGFEVPTDLTLPTTMKEHTIIEKTARFIAGEGLQMEILLKTKQARNALFDFMTQGHSLNPYYKLVRDAIKAGTYPQAQDEASEEAAAAEVQTQTTPELNTRTPSPVALKFCSELPTIRFKPSADCSYTQLISKIRGVTVQAVIDEEAESNSRQALQNAEASSVGAGAGVESAVQLFKSSSALALAQAYDSASSDDEVEQQRAQAMANSAAKAGSSSKFKEIAINISEPRLLDFPIPLDNLQHVIDKTAAYVIKNGRQFENTARQRNDELFNFLDTDNVYYPYYLYKVTGDPDAASRERKSRKAADVAAKLIKQKGLLNKAVNIATASSSGGSINTLPVAPVSFSIKSKEESTTKIANIQLQDDSDDESEHDAGKTKKSDKTEAKLRQRVPTQAPPAKSMKEKVRDKLTQIARVRLTGSGDSKEKQLQMDRKVKALAFITRIKQKDQLTNDDSSSNEARPKTGSATNASDHGDSNDSDACSVRSIPITSYGGHHNANHGPHQQQQQQQQQQQANNRGQVNNHNAYKNNSHIDYDDDDCDDDEEDDDDDVQIIEHYRLTSPTPPPAPLSAPTKRKRSHSRSRDRRRRDSHSGSDSTNARTDTTTSMSCRLTNHKLRHERRRRKHKSIKEQPSAVRYVERAKHPTSQRSHSRHRRRKRQRRSYTRSSFGGSPSSECSLASVVLAKAKKQHKQKHEQELRHKLSPTPTSTSSSSSSSSSPSSSLSLSLSSSSSSPATTKRRHRSNHSRRHARTHVNDNDDQQQQSSSRRRRHHHRQAKKKSEHRRKHQRSKYDGSCGRDRDRAEPERRRERAHEDCQAHMPSKKPRRTAR